MSASGAIPVRPASLLVAVLTLASAVAVNVQAGNGDVDDSLWTRQKLFGDMGGVRSALGERRVSLDLRLAQYYQGVADGGVDTESAYGARMDYIVNVNGERLGPWRGLVALANSTLLYPLPGQSRTELFPR